MEEVGEVMEGERIPYVAHEADMARMERSNNRLWIALVMTLILLAASNAFWLYEWTQYDEVVETSDVDIENEDGVANYIGHDGDITNGENTGTQNDQNQN